MIRLERLELKFSVRTESGGLTAILTRARDGDIEWHPDNQTVRLPTEGRPFVPIHGNVSLMIPVRQELPCPECLRDGISAGFENVQAVASHRYQKHQVAGAKRKKS